MHQIFDVFVETHLPLNQPKAGVILDADRIACRIAARIFVINIVPFEQSRVFLAGLVALEIVFKNANGVKIVGKLKVQNRIVDFALTYLFDVFLSRYFVCIPVVVGYAASKQNALEVEFFAQFLAIVVQSAAQAQTSEFRLNKYIDAVQYIALGIVGIEAVIAGYLFVSVALFEASALNY